MNPETQLDRPLPADIAVGGNRLLGYRNYPVFSWPWLWRRAIPFGIGIASMALLTTLGTGVASGNMLLGISGGAAMFGAFMVMSQVGPALATLIRHARWTLRLERVAVIAALLLGVCCGYLADEAASDYIDREIRPSLMETLEGERIREPATLPPAVRMINLVVVLAIYTALGGGLALRPYLTEASRLAARRRERELERLQQRVKEADLRMAVLQAQVEPHFLFNSLASLRALISADPSRAEAMLDALVSYLRATIPQLRESSAEVDSSLGQQLEVCASYLQLMQLRMGGRLEVNIVADDALRPSSFPPMLLMMLVENAIKHGVEPKRGAARIEISAVVDGDDLLVRVSDDGVGLQPGIGSGVGLANVREQLKIRFGDAASLALRQGQPSGAIAEVRVPHERVS